MPVAWHPSSEYRASVFSLREVLEKAEAKLAAAEAEAEAAVEDGAEEATSAA